MSAAAATAAATSVSERDTGHHEHPERFDMAGTLDTGHVGKRRAPHARAAQSLAQEEIHAIHAGGGHAHKNLPPTGPRTLDILDPKLLESTMLADEYGPHHAFAFRLLPTDWNRSSPCHQLAPCEYRAVAENHTGRFGRSPRTA